MSTLGRQVEGQGMRLAVQDLGSCQWSRWHETQDPVPRRPSQ